ncbi:MAG: S41 family peptidase [Candidatus Aminicenantes bacterium]|nr:MAG: S41 family peptidase [Candidatus Aminicenantes bacterium]
MKKKIFLIIFFIIGLILLPGRVEDTWNHSFKKISAMVSIIDENYYREINHEERAYASIRGMLQTLDPHSYFLKPGYFTRLQEEYKGKYSGLGILIQKQEDRLVVISPLEGTPAYRLGIQGGDVISHINGESTKPISSIDAVQKLRGPKGSKVNITIVRDGLEKPLELTIVRAEIPLYSVPYSFMLKEDIGYIFIRNFAETTTREFEKKMDSLIKQGMKSLILDLRGNSGGVFSKSLELSDEFLPKGAKIVSIKGRRSYYNRELRAGNDDQYEKIPLVILINRATYSASEIVSGAVKDNDRGLIVGESSWGKGLVQTVFPLLPDSAVALTTARYFTPSGRSIQRDYTNIEDYRYSKAIPETEREVRYTSGGRRVLGQGGISPDYEVKFSYQTLTADLLLRGEFFTYGRKFASRATPLSKKYIFPKKQDVKIKDSTKKAIILKDFIVNSEILEDFKYYLHEKKIEFESDKFVKAKKEIIRELEREIYSSLLGIEEGIKVYRKSDPVVLKAIEVFPEARTLVKKEEQK